ncbi:hypothetical protein [Lacrimispora sp.]|uniref:hypothetical protein n=1 Tax=Lacrimispora sp. TaxID=2719234 RepID=UPI003995FFCC
MAEINRYELVARHNPILTEIKECSPLSVGNGNFAYTADITGMQTFYEEYEKTLPLCTMAQWGWHTKPVSPELYGYDLKDVEMTEYPHHGRTVRYAVEKKRGNESVYDWVRQNPHKLNLARIGLVFKGKAVKKDRITDIYQELKLYEGIIDSRFLLNGESCHVLTASDGAEDTVAFRVKSEALEAGLAVNICFPYGSPGISASDWNCESAHITEIMEKGSHSVVLKRILDRDTYYVRVTLDHCEMERLGAHCFCIASTGNGQMAFTVSFLKDGYGKETEAEEIFERSRTHWKRFWEKGGVIDLHKSRDKRALMLERRIVRSQYLLAIQSAGDMPPQETGLTCNSWYGKAHLEMYLWHEAYLPLWNHTEMLERSLSWYLKHLPQARENAARNGYRGARWPKMVAGEGVDCPSPIATLLIWQQPHILYMLELAYQNRGGRDFLERYYPLVEETAEFMADFAVYNEERGVYELLGPVIPVQEIHEPMVTRNPAFEVEYWHFALGIAAEWAHRCEREIPARWKEVKERMAPMAVKDGCYLAHDNCPDTYESFAADHPSMLCAYGLIDSGRIDEKIMENSLKKAVECWDYASLWGWDFAVMAMTAVRLKNPEYAIDLLLMDTWKNRYVTSGNNFQEGREDLPLYLPGNGSLLLAAALMTAGYPGSEELPGFPKNGQWEVEYEGIQPFPY